MSTAPNPPEWLSDVGKTKWLELLPQIPDFDPNDTNTLALLCTSWENYLLALKEVRDNGQTLMGEKGRAFINPAVNIIAEERKSILKISKLFGLVPDARGRGKPAVENKWAKLIDG